MELTKPQKDLIAALRSGKYDQGWGRLHDETENEFCCLGVACDISGLGEWEIGDVVYNAVYLGEEATLPKEVIDYFGFRNRNGAIAQDAGTGVSRLDHFRSLAQANDSGRITFEMIADAMEQYPEKFFVQGEEAC